MNDPPAHPSDSDVTSTDEPTASLEHMVDDRNDPAELTIFPPDPNECVTQWITIDVESAVARTEMR